MCQFKLEKECGVTAVSIRNADTICEVLGTPDNVLLVSGGDTTEHNVVAVWDEGAGGAEFTHTFTGFAWGYSGTGVHGLKQFAKLVGLADILSMAVLPRLPQNVKGTVLSLSRSVWRVDEAAPEAEKVLP
jgi:hypothetical protein